ncbi:hypothetical protein JYU23_00485 [bacterium AH-315-C07]|nr:hypothetical protein [bacterium AH-315-C07]
MNITLKYRIVRKCALFLACLMLVQSLIPFASYASSKSPHAPEFSNFEPVGTDNMVDLFTGDFKYNLPLIEIPGPNGSGYALSLSYHNAGPEQEASWVGYGWTLNPGAINRNKRGFPDDWKDVGVKYWNKVRPNVTVSIQPNIGSEAFSLSTDAIRLDPSITATYRYNNYTGHRMLIGAGLSANIMGYGSLNMNYTDEGFTCGANINPGRILRAWDMKTTAKFVENPVTKFALRYNYNRDPFTIKAHSDNHYATRIKEMAVKTVHMKVSVQGNPSFLPVGLEGGFNASYAKQEYLDTAIKNAFGYFYSGSADEEDIMDYYSEKDMPFTKRNRYLAIPFSNADEFSVTGEGVGGGFRLFSKRAGHFRPNKISQENVTFDEGLEVAIGLDIGLGIDLGLGLSKTTVDGYWKSETEKGNYKHITPEAEDEAYFFRFHNDLAGDIRFTENDNEEQAVIQGHLLTPYLSSYKPSLTPTGISHVANSNKRVMRSNYIAYHTNLEMSEEENGKHYKAYTKSNSVNQFLDREEDVIKDGFGEFVVFDKEGKSYGYGLPVYSRNEKDLQYTVNEDYNTHNVTIQNNYMAYIDGSLGPEDAKYVTGEERSTPYANTFLLTEITTPDYIDKTLDGPTSDDFGGWTKFNYNQIYGSNAMESKASGGNWFRWRAPYNGLFYQKNTVSDKRDDMGVVNYGEKEVYFLESIETKTHIANFYATTPRQDGKGAAEFEEAFKENAMGDQELNKLDKIELFAKSNVGPPQLIKTVHFQYDYSLMPGQPNSSAPSKGKLTLRKVWTEYNGIVNEKISPYEFNYTYPDADYPSPKYDHLRMGNQFTAAEQNPPYNPFNPDQWGNYQFDGEFQHQNMIPWVNQNPYETNFDPAAWQLKQIILPTGGEIHVQYEQDEYLYVQDKRAMAMVSLQGPAISNRYYLNIGNDLGLPTDSLEVLKTLIQNEIIDKNEPVYFKFLYALYGDIAAIDNCQSDFIGGYAYLNRVGVDGPGLYVELGDVVGGHDIPDDICMDYVKNNRVGFLNGDCDNDDLTTGTSISAILDVVGFINDAMIDLSDFTKSNYCKKINPEHSYIRIPVLESKKGGGLRVKSLLRYDKGLEADDTVLYGSEYIYDDNGKSTGVATNEPSKGREENVLVNFLKPKNDRNFLESICSISDKDLMETPLGESILPAPSVGYSKVVTNNIHNGKTHNGVYLQEYYTVKDYPFIEKHTYPKQEKYYLNLKPPYISYLVDQVWTTQGYSFISNNMHGKIKYEAVLPAIDKSPSSYTHYEYFKPGEKIPVWNGLGAPQLENPGKEMEIVFETRRIVEENAAGGIEVDAAIALTFPIPFPTPSVAPSYFSKEEKGVFTHVTTKVIDYPAILSRITQKKDGMETIIHHVAFDPVTGNPLVINSTDEFNDLQLMGSNHNGAINEISFSAYDQYKEMGGKFQNERAKLPTTSGVTINKITAFESGSSVHYLEFVSDGTVDVCSELGKLSRGDLIEVKIGLSILDVYYADETKGNRVKIIPVSWDASLTAVATDVEVEVVHSGYTNQLSHSVGNITTYGSVDYASDFNFNSINSFDYTERSNFATALNYAMISAEDAGFGSVIPVSYSWGLKACFGDEVIRLNETPIGIVKKIEVSGDSSYRLLFDYYSFADSYSLSTANKYKAKCDDILNGFGSFKVNEDNGTLEFYYNNNSCEPVTIKCIEFCPQLHSSISLDNILQTSSIEYQDDWKLNDNFKFEYFEPGSSGNPYETGEKGKWRPQSTFAYTTGTRGLITSNAFVYDELGVFDDFTLFNWKNPDANDDSKWLEINQTTTMSPNGNGLEEKDLFNIYSTIKYGYDHSVPYLVTDNAPYKDVMFESFEKDYPPTFPSFVFEDNFTVSLSLSIPYEIKEGIAHSGKQSLKIPYFLTSPLITHEGTLDLKSFELTEQMSENGMSVKFWLKQERGSSGMLIGSWNTKVQLDISTSIECNKTAQTGEWTLYEAKITDWNSIVVGDFFTPKLVFQNLTPNGELLVDDIRVQPLDAQMTTYVYDTKTLKILTSFDDQHFGLYYQYNAEGKLVRKLIETEKGLKTIQETQYNIPKNIDRPATP